MTRKKDKVIKKRDKDTLIQDLRWYVSDKTISILEKAGYMKVSDLAAEKKEVVERLLYKNNNHSSVNVFKYDGVSEFRNLQGTLYGKFDVVFLGEYDDIGLTSEIAHTLVRKLELPEAVKSILAWDLSVYTLGDLLTIDYERIIKAGGIGETYLGILKDYVHSLGYTLKNEQPTLKETLTALREKGVQLLEEVIPNYRIYNLLYKNGIYTLDDLLNFGPEVNKLVGFGPIKQQELAEKMKELNLPFYVSPVASDKKLEENVEIPRPAVAIRPSEAIIAQVKIENDAIRARIEQKEGLVAEYDRLMEERKQLIQREKELDQLIESKVNGVKEGISHGRK